MAVRRRFAALWAVAAVALVAACASGPGATDPDTPGPGQDAREAPLMAAWLDGGRMIGIALHTTSTCVVEFEGAEFADGELDVLLAEPADESGCVGAPAALQAALVPVPAEVDPAETIRVRASGVSRDGATGSIGSVDLPGAPGLEAAGQPGHSPSAGRTTGHEDLVILLTWGSSSCPPVVDDVARAGDGEIEVALQDPAPDRVCTADMAARAAVLDISALGFAAGSDLELVVTGGEFDGVRIPVIG